MTTTVTRPQDSAMGDDVVAKVPARAKKPRDHLTPSAVREEVFNTPHPFSWREEEWTVTPADTTSLEFLEALEDDRVIHALRLLLGREQAARLIKGRNLADLEEFMEAMGEVVGSGNP